MGHYGTLMSKDIIVDSQGRSWLQTRVNGVIRSFYLGYISEPSLERFLESEEPSGRGGPRRVKRMQGGNSQG